MRRKPPSSPPLTKPAGAASGRQGEHRAVMHLERAASLAVGERHEPHACRRRARRPPCGPRGRRRRPTTKASSARWTPRVSSRKLAAARSSLPIALMPTWQRFETAPELRPVQVAADEHDAAGARLARLPRADEVAVGDHVHRLEGEPASSFGVREDALGAQQIRPLSASSVPIQALNFSGSIGLLHLEAHAR